MDSRLSQPFLDETVYTLDRLLGVAASKVGEERRDCAASVHELSGVVGVSGSATGGVVLSLPKQVARKVASKMLGREVAESDPEVKDVVGELVNTVSARAKRILVEQGLRGLRLSLPRVVVGEGRSVWLKRELPCTSISLVAEGIGPFSLGVSISPVAEMRSPPEAAEGPVSRSDRGESAPEPCVHGLSIGMKVLIVDDSVIVRQFVADVAEGFDEFPVELIQASTGPEALAAVEEHGSSLDLILCDLGIPEIDGLTVLEKVKTETDARDACFVVVTGDTSDETVARAIGSGALGFLVKPFSADEVAKLLRAVHLRAAGGGGASSSAGLPLFGMKRRTSGGGSPDADAGQDGTA
jgi:CheY-like chemotaxis protein